MKYRSIFNRNRRSKCILFILIITVALMNKEAVIAQEVSDGGTTFTIVLGPLDTTSIQTDDNDGVSEEGSNLQDELQEEDNLNEDDALTSPKTGDSIREMIKMVCLGVMSATGILLLYEVYRKRKVIIK